MPDELEAVLRLVAEGRLTPDEAAPIIEALTRAARRDAEDDSIADAVDDGFAWTDEDWGLDDRITRRVERQVERAGRRVARARARAARHGAAPGTTGVRHLRIRVTERGRQVVNLRIPIGFVDTALRFVPGIGGDQSERIRAAVRSGAIGPILDVEDPDGQGGVLISVE